MLKMLHIENIAVIEKAEVDFSPGFNVLTGETGAGKSIVIDALGAVLGGRTSKDIVRSGAASAAVSAVFSADGAQEWCRENDIEPEDGEILLMRRISAEGKNSCRVNGVPVTVQQLRSLGVQLLDIHGQNDGQKLLDEKFHLQYLDDASNSGAAAEKYKEQYEKYIKIKKDIEALSMDEREKQFKTDTLRFQIDEITRADIRPGEWEEKKRRRDLLQNSGKISSAIQSAFYALDGGDRADGAVTLINGARHDVMTAARYTEDLGDMEKALGDAEFAVSDVIEQLRDIKNSLDFSPQELDELEARLSQLRKLSIKYGDTEEEMLEYLERAKDELDGIEYSAERIERLSRELQAQEKRAWSAAEELSELRRENAEKLSKRIKNELAALSMPNVIFKVAVERLGELTPKGCDDVRFEMSANAGEKPGRISRIASGGELSRIMLAMKSVLAQSDSVEAMVFDEIDTGVSGIAAQRVAEKLAALSDNKQVICVTHLPQIAVMADSHFEIKKDENGGRTYTSIRNLDDDARAYEIARLTGGENITEITLKSAREQIAAAARFKRGMGNK